MNYDAWLEKPYTDAAERDDAFVDWCESNGYDPDDDDAAVAYDEYLDEDGVDPDDWRDAMYDRMDWDD